MGTLYRGDGWKIAVYVGEHGIPHFHVEGAGYRCSIAIDNGEIIVGSAPARVLRAARNWAEQNRGILRSKWRELNR